MVEAALVVFLNLFKFQDFCSTKKMADADDESFLYGDDNSQSADPSQDDADLEEPVSEKAYPVLFKVI